MPVAISYPGVYVEEIPSGVRTITGVATSITTFIGWAPKGPTDHAQLVLSWADFVRQFGGFNANSLLGYAVSHFFLNGGQQAYIVRLVTSGDPTPAKNAGTATLTVAPLNIKAQNPGGWANKYAVAIKNSSTPNRFQLQVVYIDPTDATKQTVVESFANLSALNPDPLGRYVGDILANQSSYIIVSPDVTQPPAPATPADTPAVGSLTATQQLTGGADGDPLQPNTPGFEAAVAALTLQGGLLDHIDLFNLLVVPGDTDKTTVATLEKYCRDRRAFLIADCASDATLTSVQTALNGITGTDSINAALYFPYITAPDPLSQNMPSQYPPSGFVAGIYARTDATRGVWKAPAGTDASLTGALGVAVPLSDGENGILNPRAVNCIRNFNVYGTIVWGARTLQGNDEVGSEWKYVPVRRTALYIEESLFRALKWVVFEPNDEPLWAEIRLNVGAFMHNLFRQHAFQGLTPSDAYFVKCDKETTTQNDINLGIVNIVVGFAPLKPAEFVVIQIQQMAGQIAT